MPSASEGKDRPERGEPRRPTDVKGKAVGALELILIFALIVLIFGATRLPKLARSVGKAPDEFKAGLEDPPDDRNRVA